MPDLKSGSRSRVKVRDWWQLRSKKPEQFHATNSPPFLGPLVGLFKSFLISIINDSMFDQIPKWIPTVRTFSSCAALDYSIDSI